MLRNDHIFLTSAPEIRELAKPLLSLGITYFSYGYHHHDGGRVWLCNAPENVENYYLEKKYLIGNTESHPRNYSAQTVLWSTLPNQKVFEFAREFGIAHGIFIIEPKKNFCEFFAFATTPDNHHIINTYLTNMDYLKRFGEFFKEKAHTIIREADQNKLFLPYHENKISKVENINSDFLITRSHNFPKLTQRQRSCALLLVQGKTIKEIAVKFNLSPRTVETYINNLKSKLNCANKTELILKLAAFFSKN